MFLIAGPCVIESLDLCLGIAEHLRLVTDNLGMEFYFKASYDKANRTSIDSFRGPGLDTGLEILSTVKNKIGVKVLSDVHSVDEVGVAADVLDVIQIPAFLCRQTDLIVAAGQTGKTVNLKKGQFATMSTMYNAVSKANAKRTWVTERGSCFGHDIVVDFRNFGVHLGFALVYDASHSSTDSIYIQRLARAAVAAGIDGLFLEVHPDPENAKCDGKTSFRLDRVRGFLESLVNIEKANGL